MSKARGSSMMRKMKRLHIDPFQGRKFKRKSNKAGKYYKQEILDKDGNVIKTIYHRKDGSPLSKH